jgi:hypothetical protein
MCNKRGLGEERRRNHQHRDGRRGRRKGKREKRDWWCTVLVHNISRSDLCQFVFCTPSYAPPAMTPVPFTFVCRDSVSHRIDFFSSGEEKGGPGLASPVSRHLSVPVRRPFSTKLLMPYSIRRSANLSLLAPLPRPASARTKENIIPVLEGPH